MKAIVQDRYGSPDVLRLAEIDTPEVDDNGVLVRIRAASVNALDWHCTRGMPYIMRLDAGMKRPKVAVRGVDLAGRVAAVGKNVTRFKVGDDVFGGTNGSFAEYTVTTAARLAHMPTAMTYESAAALHVAGMTALQGLQHKANVQPGQRVLINGAGGGVGTFAVQIAKAMGAHVTAVTRRESREMVRALGADEIIDHSVEDFTQRKERYDVVFDIGGNRPLKACCRMVGHRGVVIVAGGPAGRWLAPATRIFQAVALSPFVRPRLVGFISKNDASDLATLAELANAGKITPVIDRHYDLDNSAAAIAHVGTGHARGKIVIRVS